MAFDTHGASGKPWTGFDLDGTLAMYDKWRGIAHIGDPVKPMCDLIKKLHGDGKDVKIVTARVAPREDGSHLLARAIIARWCRDNLGFIPPITHEKDALMETLYDDRVKAVEQNTGKVLNMAKFKVGQKVSLMISASPTYGLRLGDILDEKGQSKTGRIVKVIDPNDGWNDPEYEVDGDLGRALKKAGRFKVVGEDDLVLANAARSTNSIVAKALNAALPIGDIGVSDSTILWRMIGGGRDEPYHDEYQKRLDKMNQRDIPEDTISILKKYGYRFKNSSAARNAEFNVGDKVRIKNPNRQIGQDDGTYEVTLIRPDGMISIKAPSEKVGFAVRPEQLIANAARNDVLGRYKPGARVAVELRTRPIIGKVMEFGGRPEVEHSPTTRTRFTGTLIKQNGDKWDIKSDSGEIYKDVKEADFGLIYNSRSRNAVVQKALNAARATALNWNFKNSYQFFCVDPSLKAPCILSGWDYREDAKDDAAELKEAGIPHKIVSRRFLEQQGIDPNAESSWKKNRQ